MTADDLTREILERIANVLGDMHAIVLDLDARATALEERVDFLDPHDRPV